MYDVLKVVLRSNSTVDGQKNLFRPAEAIFWSLFQFSVS